MSNSLQSHTLQHARLFCPSLSPWVCSDSCPLSRWCYLTISFSTAPFSFCLQYFPASVSFPVSHLFTLNGKSIAVYAPATIFPVNIEGWFPLWLTGLISLPSSLHHHKLKTSIRWPSAFFMDQLSHPYMTMGKAIALTLGTFLDRWCLCFLIYCLGLS